MAGNEKAKRANGEGSFEKLKNGWRYRAVVEVDGVRQRKSFIAPSKTAARQAYEDWLESGQKVAVERVRTVRDWAQNWFEIYYKPKVQYITWRNTEAFLRLHVLPFSAGGKPLGDMRLADVKPAHVAALYAGLRTRQGKPLARNYMKQARTISSGIFSTAIDNGLCSRDPTAGVKLPEKPPNQIAVPPADVVEAVLGHANGSIEGAYVAILLYTGLRVEELLALKWENIDQERRLIHVCGHLVKTPDGETVQPSTKTKRTRLVPYDAALQPHFDRIPHMGEYVVSRDAGGAFTHHDHNSFYQLYYGFFAPLPCVPRLTPHKLRHTYATYLWESGVDLGIVQRLLGHNDIGTTTIYAHARIEALRGGAEKLSFSGQPQGNAGDSTGSGEK